MIDWKRVEELKSEVGPEDFAEVVEIFLEEMDSVMGEIPTVAPDAISEKLHFIKGCALNLGFDALGQLCSTLEIRSSDPGGQDINRDEIIATYEASRRAFFASGARSAA